MTDIPAGGGGRDLWGAHKRQRAVRTATGMRLDLRIAEIWDRRDVLKMFITRGLKVKYASSVLGYAWSLIEPTMFILIYFVLVSRILSVKRPEYALFIGCTMLPWLWFNGTVTQSLGSLRSNGRLITSIALPREIYPLSAVGEKFVEYLASLPVIVLTAILYKHAPNRYLALFPLAVLMELLLITGAAMFISAMNTVLRDVQRMIGIILRVLFYMTPVLYSVKDIKTQWVRILYECNPLVGIFEMHRAAWFLPEHPHTHQTYFEWTPVYFAAAGSLLVFFIGYWTFTRLERPVLKEL